MTPPFNVASGGIRVMYGLYGWLLAKGQVVFLNATIDTDFVAIYPEIYYNNQAGARTVVRYILNKPGTMALFGVPGPTEYPKSDILYVFSQIFNSDLKVPDDHIMFLPILNLHLFRDYGRKRTKKAVFFGKGKDKGLHPADCIPIDRQLVQNQQKLADLLNECEVLYSYDPVSALFELSRLCGCRVVVFPSIYSKEEFQKYEPGMNGISWGLEENVPLDSEGFRKHYVQLRRLFSQRLDKFIEETQNA